MTPAEASHIARRTLEYYDNARNTLNYDHQRACMYAMQTIYIETLNKEMKT